MSSLVGLFAKVPKPGRVKTRLCPPLTEVEAIELHIALVAQSLDLVRRAAASVGGRCELSWSEAVPTPSPIDIQSDVRISTQSKGDLGRRMGAFFKDRLEDGFDAVVLLGSDSPSLPPEHVRTAVTALEKGRAEIVFGPSFDGGYYLVGMSRQMPEVFAGVDWGTERVLTTTLDILSRSGVEPMLLPSWFDVDRPADLLRLIQEHRSDEGKFAEPLRTILEQLARRHWPSI